MLLIPIDHKLDWHHPPWVTLFLVVVNVSCFLLWQGADAARMQRALRYYFDSGLAAQELPFYVQLKGRPLPPAPRAATSAPPPEQVRLAQEMVTDLQFQDALRAEAIARPGTPPYAAWREDRTRYEALLAEVVYLQYGFRTARPSPVAAFTHMFLHADWGHLLGNLFFLVAVGSLVEQTLGRLAFLGAYLLGGLFSLGFYDLAAQPSLVPSIGASGAIAGLMGMFTVLYWTRPVRFFYFVLVYFDYVRLPAIALLPLWLAGELVQLLRNGDSHINYLAHLGGLLGGALIGAGIRALVPSFSLARVDQQDRREEVERGLEEAATLCRRLEYDKARPLLRRLRALAPDNIEVLALLRETLRTDTADAEYHALSRALIALPGTDLRARTLVHETFDDYLGHARPKPRIDSALACRLATRFVREGKHQAAELLAGSLIENPGACGSLREVLAHLIVQARQAQDAPRVARLQEWQQRLAVHPPVAGRLSPSRETGKMPRP